MLRQLALALALALAILSLVPQAGAQSVLPFYEKDDIVFRPELLGRWTTQGVEIEIVPHGSDGYGIGIMGDEDTGFCFVATLFRMDGRYFLDGRVSGLIFPEKKASDAAPAQEPNPPSHRRWVRNAGESCFDVEKDDVFFNRAHGLLLVTLGPDPDKFSLALWQDEWLPKMAEDKKLSVSSVKDESGRILLTGHSSEMRLFVLTLPAEAFDKPHELERVKENRAGRPNAPNGTAIGTGETERQGSSAQKATPALKTNSIAKENQCPESWVSVLLPGSAK
ncbi:MAG TPA: hypothetical protein VMT51_01055 [Dongiaceae bacterium]|nr:hypothetical protein [Dongiaceae bacterium]